MTSQVAVIRATLKYMTQEDFIKGMGPLITKCGLFIHTKSTRPVGAEIQFEFQLADGSIKYSGEGIVRKEIPYREDTASRSGMLIALRRVNRSFKEVVDIVLGNADKPAADQADVKTEVNDVVEDAAPAAATRAQTAESRRQIVENHSGGGIDIFGDLDMDEGLDSLFSSIEKPSSMDAIPKVQDSFLADQEDNLLDGEPPRNEGWSGVAQEEVSSGYQDAPTPQPTNYVASAYNNMPSTGLIARSQKKTGEFEAVEYIAEAERKLVSGQFAPVNADGQPVGALSESEEEALVNEEVREALEASASNRPMMAESSTLEMAPSSSMFNPDVPDIGDAKTQINLQSAQSTVESEIPIGDQDTLVFDAIDDEPEAEAKTDAPADESAQDKPEGTHVYSRETLEQVSPSSGQPVAESEAKTDAYSHTLPTPGTEETPSELFAALQEDLLGEAEAQENPATPAAPAAPAAPPAPPVVPEGLKLASIQPETQPANAATGDNPNAPAGLDYFNAPRQRKNEPVQLEDLLKRAEIKTQDTQDIVMANVSKKKAAARRRVVAEEQPLEVPTEKKGFFSSLFKK